MKRLSLIILLLINTPIYSQLVENLFFEVNSDGVYQTYIDKYQIDGIRIKAVMAHSFVDFYQYKDSINEIRTIIAQSINGFENHVSYSNPNTSYIVKEDSLSRVINPNRKYFITNEVCDSIIEKQGDKKVAYYFSYDFWDIKAKKLLKKCLDIDIDKNIIEKCIIKKVLYSKNEKEVEMYYEFQFWIQVFKDSEYLSCFDKRSLRRICKPN